MGQPIVGLPSLVGCQLLLPHPQISEGGYRQSYVGAVTLAKISRDRVIPERINFFRRGTAGDRGPGTREVGTVSAFSR